MKVNKVEVIELSRKIMDYMNAFKGSKPVLHNSEAMIIKGISRTKVDIDKRSEKLQNLFKEFDIIEVPSNSKKANDLTEKIDQVFRNTTEVYDEANGILGIENLKHSFEITGFAVDYIIGEIDGLAVFISVWSEKSNVGPMFVESMVVNVKDVEITLESI